MKKLIAVMLILFAGVSAQAQEKKNKNAKEEIAVSGNCDQCKKRIEKAAYSVKGVKSADWHADHQDMHLIYDENKCSLDDIRKAVAATGHDTDEVKATDEAYEDLHGCCKYDRTASVEHTDHDEHQH
ncbi:metal transporter [Flavobacterium akiainvivens]|uniref:Metal transporter n=1 Tax=Flavobacterium akiainvivens TaxID=1202724 RepID=A0A0M8ML50_9FLAO|nr:heavy-metal-associated domain-containing protein [Flavobacterium akiainvivens]KOS07778.1 metal transporter [Flavobacterium akiainvivens]SFQ26146.1 Copper chaperone CopZ [Flavobacterium akiainvivens]